MTSKEVDDLVHSLPADLNPDVKQGVLLVAKYLKDPVIGSHVEEMLRLAVKAGGWEEFLKSLDPSSSQKNLGGQGSGYFGHSGREGHAGGSDDDNSGTSHDATNVAHIHAALSSMPQGSRLTVGPETYTALSDGTWASGTGATLGVDAMSSGPVNSLVSNGLLAENTLTPEQQLYIAAELLKKAKKNALNVPLLAFGLSASADWASTAWALKNGGVEQNPTVAWLKSPPAIIAAGAGLDALGAWTWMKVVGPNHPKIQAAGLYIATAVRGAIVIHNIKANSRENILWGNAK